MSPSDKDLFGQMLPSGVSHLTPKELAAVSGYSARHIIDCYDSGKVMGFASNGRSKKGSEAQKAIRIPRFAALIWLMECSNFSADTVLGTLVSIAVKNLPHSLISELVDRLNKEISR